MFLTPHGKEEEKGKREERESEREREKLWKYTQRMEKRGERE